MAVEAVIHADKPAPSAASITVDGGIKQADFVRVKLNKLDDLIDILGKWSPVMTARNSRYRT